MTQTISLKIDLISGQIEISSPPENYAQVSADAKEMLRLGRERLAASAEETKRAALGRASGDSTRPSSSQSAGVVRKAVRQSGGSSDRPGRIGSFEPINFEFTEKQERELMGFYKQKNPSDQDEQVAVAIYQGEKILGRKHFSYDEIYTLLKSSGAELPKALDVVVTRMLRKNWAQRTSDGISLKFVARDYVEKDLPRKG